MIQPKIRLKVIQLKNEDSCGYIAQADRTSSITNGLNWSVIEWSLSNIISISEDRSNFSSNWSTEVGLHWTDIHCNSSNTLISNKHKSITAFALSPSAHSSKVRDRIPIDGRYHNVDESISLSPTSSSFQESIRIKSCSRESRTYLR